VRAARYLGAMTATGPRAACLAGMVVMACAPAAAPPPASAPQAGPWSDAAATVLLAEPSGVGGRAEPPIAIEPGWRIGPVRLGAEAGELERARLLQRVDELRAVVLVPGGQAELHLEVDGSDRISLVMLVVDGPGVRLSVGSEIVLDARTGFDRLLELWACYVEPGQRDEHGTWRLANCADGRVQIGELVRADGSRQLSVSVARRSP
jgi:hypothetical protein